MCFVDSVYFQKRGIRLMPVRWEHWWIVLRALLLIFWAGQRRGQTYLENVPMQSELLRREIYPAGTPNKASGANRLRRFSFSLFAHNAGGSLVPFASKKLV